MMTEEKHILHVHVYNIHVYIEGFIYNIYICIIYVHMHINVNCIMCIYNIYYLLHQTNKIGTTRQCRPSMRQTKRHASAKVGRDRTEN